MKQIDIVPFPCGAESNGFIAALASAVLPCIGITGETPYWCAPKGSYCTRCSSCNSLHKHQEMLYHTLLVASGLAFAFDYPEDDSVPYHTLPGIPAGWRWEEPFVSDLMDFAGLTYERRRGKTAVEMYEMVKLAVDAGYTALAAKQGQWSVVCGYTDDALCMLHYGGELVNQRDADCDDWIVITGRTERKQTFRELLERIYRILTDPSHATLEQEIDSDLSTVTPENAAELAYKMMGINGVPIEARWHSAEAFCSCDNLLSSLTENASIRKALSDLFFSRYIASNNNETHGTGWKIWGALNVGPDTGYLPTEESFTLIQQPKVQEELKRLFRIVFDNDRAVAEGICEILEKLEKEA